MAPLLASQPLKALYTTLFLLKTPPHVLILYLRYLVKPSHPDCKWHNPSHGTFGTDGV